jgi:hypothetical protein
MYFSQVKLEVTISRRQQLMRSESLLVREIFFKLKLFHFLEFVLVIYTYGVIFSKKMYIHII